MSLVISQTGAAFSVWITGNIARRGKKAFFSDQCKEIEENNRLGKTRDLFKKIRDTMGTCHSKVGTIKDRMECRPGRGGEKREGWGRRGDPGVVVGRGPDRVPGRREPEPGRGAWRAVSGPRRL